MGDRKGKYLGILGALIVHAAIIALLLVISLTIPEKEEESGVEVLMGETQDAFGGFDPSTLVDVEVIPQPEVTEVPALPSDQDLITQAEEETVVVEAKKDEIKKQPEKTEAEKAAEARKLAQERAERERKAAAEAANKLVAGAFNKGAEMGESGQTSGEGVQGSPTGSPDADFANTQSSGRGPNWFLRGRSIGAGGLPVPVYNVQDEGIVVVQIVVNPEGRVTGTSVVLAADNNKSIKTNTTNPELRKAALEAAKRARFNSIDGTENQTGTIAYFFNLK